MLFEAGKKCTSVGRCGCSFPASSITASLEGRRDYYSMGNDLSGRTLVCLQKRHHGY